MIWNGEKKCMISVQKIQFLKSVQKIPFFAVFNFFGAKF